MVASELSLEALWGRGKLASNLGDVRDAAQNLRLSDTSINVITRKGAQREVVECIEAVTEGMRDGSEDSAAAGCLLLFSMSESIHRPEALRMALSALFQAISQHDTSPAVANNCVQALASLFQCCARIDGTASKALGRVVSDLLHDGNAWKSVMSVMKIHLGVESVQQGGAGAIWGLTRWSTSPPVKPAMEILFSSMQQHPQAVSVLHACTAAISLLCWRSPHSLLSDSLCSPQILFNNLDSHPSSQGLLMHMCGALMLMLQSQSLRQQVPLVQAVRAGLRAVRLAKGDEEKVDKIVDMNESMSEYGWGLLLVLSQGFHKDTEGKAQKVLIQEGVLNEVWDILESRTGQYSPRRHEACWRIAQNLHKYEEQKESRHWVNMHTGGLETVRKIMPAMQQHEEICGLQELYCWALQQILSDNVTAESQVQEHPGSCDCLQCSVGRTGIVIALVCAMNAHPRARAVQLFSCAALLRIADGNDQNSQRMVRSGAVALLVGAMEAHIRIPDLQLVVCRTLRELCSRGSEALEQLQREEGVIAVLDSMRFHREDLNCVRAACELIRVAAWGHEQRKSIGAEGGVGILLTVMKMYPKSLEVQRDLCGCLHALSWNNDNKEMIVAGGGVEGGTGGIRLVVEAMMSHPDDSDLQQQACSALAIMSYFVDVNKLEICENGGIQAIIFSLSPPVLPQLDKNAQSQEEKDEHENKLKEIKMQEELKDKILERNKKSMTDGRGVEVLISAMRVFYNDVVVVERSCRALVQLSFNSWENAQRIMRDHDGHDGLDVICKAMDANVAKARVLEQACAALKNVFASLYDAPKDKRKFPSDVEKFVVCIIRAMRKHQSNADLQRQGCSALGNIASVSDTANNMMTPKRAVEIVITVMAEHSDNAQVQDRACRTLQGFCRSKTNLKQLKDLNHSQLVNFRPIHVLISVLGVHAKSASVASGVLRVMELIAEPGSNKDSQMWQRELRHSAFVPFAAEVRKHQGCKDWSKDQTKQILISWEKIAKMANVKL